MEVFSFGNGDFLFEIFGAVTGLMGNSSYMTLVRLTILIGFLILGYQLFFSLRIDAVAKGFLKQYILIIVIFYTFFVPKTDVIIRDEIKNTQVTVNNVPYGIGMMAHLFTTAEKGITGLVETYFSTPSDMRFSKSGYAFSAMMIDTLKYGTATNVYFKRTFNDYVEHCFFTDVLYGDKDLNTVINTSNSLLAMMNPVSSAAMFTNSYSAANPQGTQVSCSTAYTTITSGIGAEVTAGIAQLNNIMQVDITAKLPVVANTILGVSQSATETISQAIAANTIKSALTQTAMYTGASGDAVMYATSLAEQQQRSSWAVGGELAKKYIPVIRQILEAIIYGLFPMLFLGMMTPMGFQFVRVYMTFLIWLLMWSPLFAILNLIINTRLNGALSATYGYFSLGKMPFIYETTNDLVAMAGYMAWLVPTIAFAVAKGSDYAMVNMASGITQSTSMTQSRAAQAVTGPGGAMQSPAMAGHMQAAAAYGTDTVAAGGAASSFFNSSYGASWSARGTNETGGTAATEVKGRVFSADSNSERMETLQKDLGTAAPQKIGAQAGSSESGAVKGTDNLVAFLGEQGIPINKSGYFEAKNSVSSPMPIPEHLTPQYGHGTMQPSVNNSGGAQVHMSSVKDGYKRDSSVAIQPGDNSQHGVTSVSGANFTNTHDAKTGNLSAATGKIFNGEVVHNQSASISEKAAQQISSKIDWSQAYSGTTSTGERVSNDKQFSETTRNAFNSNFSQSLEKSSGFSDTKTRESIQQLAATVGAGGDLLGLGLVKAGGEYRIAGQTSDGHTASVAVSEKDAEAFSKAREEAKTNTISQMASTSEGREELARVTKDSGVSESVSKLSEAQQVNQAGVGSSQALLTEFVKHYGDEHYGNKNNMSYIKDPETRYAKANEEIQSRAAAGGATSANLTNDFMTFAAAHLSGSTTASEAGNKISGATSSIETAKGNIQSQVEPTINKVVSDTSKVNTSGDPRQDLGAVDQKGFDKVKDNAEASIKGAKDAQPGTPFQLIYQPSQWSFYNTENTVVTPGQRPDIRPVESGISLKDLQGIEGSSTKNITTLTVGEALKDMISQKGPLNK